MTTPEPTTPESTAPGSTTPEPTPSGSTTPEPTTPGPSAPGATDQRENDQHATDQVVSDQQAEAARSGAPQSDAPRNDAPQSDAPEDEGEQPTAPAEQQQAGEPGEQRAEPENRPWTRVEPLADSQAVVARVGGDVDHNTAEVLDEGLEEALSQAVEAGALLVVVDLQEVGFVASTGLSSLIRVHNAAKDKGLELVVALPEEHRLSRLLWLTALSRILTVTNSVEEALKQAPRNPA